MSVKVLKDLDEGNRAAFSRQLNGRNLEEALSRLRRISALLEEGDKLDELTKAAATDLDKLVCQAIVNNLKIDNADLTAVYNLAAWPLSARRGVISEPGRPSAFCDAGSIKVGVPETGRTAPAARVSCRC